MYTIPFDLRMKAATVLVHSPLTALLFANAQHTAAGPCKDGV